MAFEVTVDTVNASYCQFEEGWVWLKTEDSIMVRLHLSSIQVEGHPAQESDFGEATIVVIAPRENPSAGYIKTLKMVVEKSDPLFEWRFAGMRSLGSGNINNLLFYGLLETSVLTKNKRLLATVKANFQQLSSLGISLEFTLNFLEYLERAHKPESLKYLSSFMEDQEYIRVLGKELADVATAYYHGKEMYGKLMDIGTDVWVTHALASVFDVILIEVKADQNTLQCMHFYPNSLSPWNAPLYFQSTPPRLLYPIESFHLQTVPGRFTELLLHRNWLSCVRERLEFHRCIPESSSNDTLCALYNFITSEYQDPLPSLDLSSEAHCFPPPDFITISHVCDPISVCLKEEVARMKPLTELLKNLYCCFCKQVKADHRFPCRCGACANCIYTKLIETEMIHCPIHNQIVAAEELQPHLPPQTLSNANRYFKHSKCSKCGLKAKRRDFPIKRKATPLIYVLDCGDHVCVTCLETAARFKTGECPTCSTLVNMHESELAAQEAICTRCKKRKPIGSDFSSVKCKDHRSCTACLSVVRDASKCPTCDRVLNADETYIVQKGVNLECHQCKRKCSSQDLWSSAGPCDCVLCRDCGVKITQKKLNIVACPLCLKGQYDPRQVLERYHIALSSGFAELEEVPEVLKILEDRKLHTKCKICYDNIPDLLSRATSSKTCPHLFHRECLGQALENQIEEIRVRQLKRKLRCPVQNCPLEVDTEFLSGRYSIISIEFYNKYQEYEIMLEELEFTCKECKNQGFIPADQRNFQCPCGYNQCVKCHGLWSNTHNDRVCEYYLIQALTQAVVGPCAKCEGKGCDHCTVAQCPGCKYPYLKDDHCDHVKCQRPECGVEFCFRCACLRKPTLEHSNQWHRQQCQWYPNDNKEEVNKKVIADEKQMKGCPECTRLGRRCDPPPNLQQPRLFSLEEFLAS